jgi:hypothetical protein
MPAKKQSRYGGRMDPALRERLDRIHAVCLTNDSRVIHELLAAFCEAVEERGAVFWPAVVLMADTPQLLVAENKPKLAIKEKPPDKGKSKRGAGPDADVRKPA